jgi:amino acid adenylation domain-containing protein
MHNVPPEISTLVDLLQFRATHAADHLAYLFLPEGETREIRLTYADLDLRARAIAVALQRRGAVGERVLLLAPSGLEYISALFGCLYAGAVAVPVYLFAAAQPESLLLGIRAIVRETHPALALTTSATLATIAAVWRQDQEMQEVDLLATDTLPGESALAWQAPGSTGSTLAVLQYTSGSTGRPKGVMITHGNLLSNQQMIQEAWQHPARVPFVNWLPLSHKMGLIGSVLQALYTDAPCVLLPPEAFLQKPVRWLQAISRYRAHTSGGPAFAYDLCARHIPADQRAALDLRSWKIAFTSSEPIRQKSLQNFLTFFAPCHFTATAWYPMYGLAEATAFVAGGRLPVPPVARRAGAAQKRALPAPGVSAIGGRAWLEGCLLIVDPERRTVCLPGQVGEIWVAGPHVAQGYWNDVQATRHTFAASLPTGEGPFLRTGDQGYLKDGELFVSGRMKEQIVIADRTYDPQDIEQTVEQCHPRLCALACAAFSVPVQHTAGLVIVHEVERAASRTELAEASAAIRARVASVHGLAPHAIVLIGSHSLPRTACGTLQRAEAGRRFLEGSLDVVCQSLCDDIKPDEDSARQENLFSQLMRSPPEEKRRQFIESYLQTQIARLTGNQPDAMDWHHPIGALGLDSLTGLELRHRVETDIEVLLPPEELLCDQTIPQLASVIASVRDEWPSARSEAAVALWPARELCGIHPLSSVQQGLWFLHQLRPASNEQHLAFCVQISGLLNIAWLERALNEILARHAILRATLVEQEGIAELLINPYQAFRLPVEECSFAGESIAEETARRRAYAEAMRPFDLVHGPLCRFLLLQMRSDAHVLCLDVHHLVFDGWSLGVFLRELLTLYSAYTSGHSCTLPPLPTHYGEYIAWQRTWLQSPEYARQLCDWQRRLAGLPALLHLPTDHPRSARRSYCAARHSFAISRTVVEQLRQLARREQTTLFTTLLAAFQVLLFRYSGQQDIIVGTPVSGRRQAALKDVIGCFVNLLAIRTDFSTITDFMTVLQQVKATLLAASARADVPFEAIVEALGPERDLSHAPLVQVTFAMHNVPLPALQAETIRLSLAELARDSISYDLSLSLLETPAGLQGHIDYAADLFELPTIQRLIHHFRLLLQGIVASPHRRISDFGLLTQSEQEHLVKRWNGILLDAPLTPCLPQIFELRAQRTPDAIALVFEQQQLSYGDLNTRANQLAHVLQQQGVGPEKIVGVYMHRSFELVIALLAVLKAGGAYLPLDPIYPRKRLTFLLEDARVSVVLTLERLREYMIPGNVPLLCLDREWSELARGCPANPAGRTHQENLACVLYTANLLDRPGGVQITHRGLSNLVNWHQQTFALSARDRTTQLARWSFDAAGWELWPSLAAGAVVHLVADEVRDDPACLWAWLAEQQITRSFLPTPLAEHLLSEQCPPGLSLRTLLTGGDLLHRGPAYPLPFVLVNNYGPLENTVVTTSGVVEPSSDPGRVPAIGRSIGNVRVYVLDSSLQPVPIGVVGALYIGGASLARGYGGLVERTAEHFIPDPFSGEAGARLYCTDDLVRYLPDGSLAFVGRLDQQVRIGGIRIDSGEIERVLQGLEQVRASAVMVREDRPANRTLVAYVVPARPAVDPEVLRRQLRTLLPDYIVPASFVLLDALPLTPAGTVDRRALPAPARQRVWHFVTPRTLTEELLAAIWSELLGVSQISIEDNFLTAGGHSLLVPQAIAHIKQIFQVDISVQGFFEARCLADLASLIAERQPALQTLRIITALADRDLSALSPRQRVRMLAHLREQWADDNDIPAMVRVQRIHSSFPLSFAQQHLWFLYQEAPQDPTSTICTALQVHGPLNVSVLQRSIHHLVQRHESLRTIFLSGEGQVLLSEVAVPLLLLDLEGLPPSVRADVVCVCADAESVRPFRLECGPLLRCTLLRLERNEHLLLLCMHQMISDSRSVEIFLQELGHLYTGYARGEQPQLPVLPIQYIDFAIWQRRWLRGARIAQREAYWRDQLRGAVRLDPLAGTRSPLQQLTAAAALPFQLGAQLAANLQVLSQQAGATMFMTLLGAFLVVLQRHTGQEDLVVGTASVPRNRPEVEQVIGFFVDLLVLHVRLSGNLSFREVLARVRRATLAASDHQDILPGQVVDLLHPQRDGSRTPLVQIMFALHQAPQWTSLWEGITAYRSPMPGRLSRYDLALELVETSRGISGSLQYRTALFEAATIHLLGEHYQRLLAALVAAPDVPVGQVLSEAERE